MMTTAATSKALDPRRKSSAAEGFEASMRSKIVGQASAIEAVTSLYQIYLAGLNPGGRPIGNLLFLGPTGSGKTRVVEAMAESLYDDPHALIKIDCAEFQHSHEIAKLIGSPPGYLGHRETHPVITQEALNQWHTNKTKISLVLFDEIEKASDALWQLLLGILDKATLTLGDNRRVDLSQCIIFMTSNLGAKEMNGLVEGGIGFVPSSTEEMTPEQAEAFQERIDRAALEAARHRFPPEFLNRIDQLVVFRSLSSEQLRKILDLELDMVQQRVLASGHDCFLFRLSERAKDFLLQEGVDRRYGARHLKRAIERHLVHPLANLVASGQVRQGDSIMVDLEPTPGQFASLDAGWEMSFIREKEGLWIPRCGPSPSTPQLTEAVVSAAGNGRRAIRRAD